MRKKLLESAAILKTSTVPELVDAGIVIEEVAKNGSEAAVAEFWDVVESFILRLAAITE